jgi:hypothetical protein
LLYHGVEAATENLSMSRQLRECYKVVQARKIAKANNMPFEDALDMIEKFAPQNRNKFVEIDVQDFIR